MSVIVDAVRSRRVATQMLIPFDKIVKDDFGLFSLESSSFEAPWAGNFTFTETDFRCGNQERDFYIVINGKVKLASNEPVTIHLEKSDQVSFSRGNFESVPMACTKDRPCRLEITFHP